eukprot:Gb_29510 [translate_table: standard]
MVLCSHKCNLIFVQPSKSEHSNLLKDMTPISRGSTSLQSIIKLMAHTNNAVCHVFQFNSPIIIKIPVTENGCHNRSTVQGWA